MKNFFTRFLIAVAAITILQISFAKAQWSLTGNAGTSAATNYVGTTDLVNLNFRTNNTNRMTITSAGKIGIGTTAPSYAMDVKADSNCTFRVQSKVYGASNLILSRFSNTVNALVNYKTGNANVWLTGCKGNDDFSISNASNTTLMTIVQATGNFGIGTTTPANKFSVVGAIQSTSGGFVFPDATTQTTAFVPYSGGTGIGIVGTTISNTAPDQTVSLTNGTGISATGTYPNFTITNTAPDQVVSLTQGGATTITGSYPNFTISSVDNNTTYSAGTGLTLTSTTFSNNLSTGVSGGQTAIGGTAASNNLTLSSTSNATKGKILFGNSAYNESNNRLGIGAVNPSATLDVNGKLTVAGADGDLTFTDHLGSITFPAATAGNSPMIQMFATGTGNADRMVIAHSSGFPTWGLQYQDATDKFNFLSSGLPVLTVDLTSSRVGIFNSSPAYKLDVSGDAHIVNNLIADANVGIGNTSPGYKLDVTGVIHSTGNILTDAFVGVGTTTPGEPVDVNYSSGSQFAGIRAKSTNANGYAGMMIDRANNTSNGVVFYQTAGITEWYAGEIQNSTNDYYLSKTFASPDGSFMIQNSTSFVGIGTTAPTARLHVNGLTGEVAFRVQVNGSSKFLVNDNGSTCIGSVFGTTGPTNGLYVSGAVTIGTTTQATGYALNVNGKAIFTEARVEAFGSWPDYVFAGNYKLMSIADLKKSIAENNHLPGMPSACEVEDNGIMLGQMSTKTMEKLEEAMLYIIQLNDENAEMKNQIAQLQTQVAELLKR